MMMTDNMLRVSCGFMLHDFQVQVDEKGEPTGDPFDWRLLCISPDMGPDILATDAFLSYEKNINLQCDYDQSHTLNNASKGALRTRHVRRRPFLFLSPHPCRRRRRRHPPLPPPSPVFLLTPSSSSSSSPCSCCF
eukprot:9469829-Pyramimonas_sp.AAC.1